MHGSRALPVRPYFALAFGWTWALWWTAAAFPQLPGSLLFMTGGLGPLMGAAWIVQRGGDAYRRRFLHRVWDPRGITAPWWSAMLAVTAAPALLGAVAADLAGVAATLPDRSAAAVGGGVALAAGLVEEPGWRGVVSDAWQTRMWPVWAALSIGALWALWHLPLYFVDGSYQQGLGFRPVRFWLTNVVLV